ncbi:putative Hydroxymethylglutaryl-CoA synthase [Taphrina deformans PYCC 5710]|uniref:Hydroxymethylglutaryl-CoA synthase n=1 Tax=Taphrina deformans (strain PYCC 5710 / ATCC 11124 / CBS 356.35 / IMI 108563 / JCM 9778 / NBRC 8474) TaxID=1097556 RepID=R4XJT7_TAPDE|nr:putative Hydroxymethylglutaryl-CoA synthase [Taphrina deformans PYCC 5710]|eukprot:CCG83612.1 putative Hydroxymethylglutaryl-CoA synthase [Taphrina deformans PYCC 5710]
MSNIGIKAIQIHFPNQCISQTDLEKHDGVAAGKYTIGLGQTEMGFCDDREDIYSMCLTSLSQLIKNYNIDTKNIGRLEVGTETLIDKSKSVKSVLMQLFKGNHDIEGVDTVNACYGGTNALFNAYNWVSSADWDGRDAIVVCGDIALYAKGAARPTGGAGSVAMLIGRDAPIALDAGLRATFMDHVYDFYKPDFTSEYPVVFGQYSVGCYTNASDETYSLYQKKFDKKHSTNGHSEHSTIPLDRFDYVIAHSPTTKTVQKAYGRMMYNDYLKDPANAEFFSIGDTYSLEKVSHEASLSDKALEKAFVTLSKSRYNQRVAPGVQASTHIGNMYTASLYGGLVSLLTNVGSEALQGKRIGAYSYGSGLAASIFSFTVRGDVSNIIKVCDLKNKLEQRAVLSAVQYEEFIALRERAHLNKDFEPQGEIKNLSAGTYYLTKVDDMYRRSYDIKA